MVREALTRHLMLTSVGSHVMNFMGHLKTDREELIRENSLPKETCTMVRMFRPAGHCKEIQRYGGEGGKWVCGMSSRPETRRVIYSIGSNYQVQDVQADLVVIVVVVALDELICTFFMPNLMIYRGHDGRACMHAH